MADNLIPFQQVLNRQQRGIVFDQAINARIGWRLDTAERNLIEKVNDIIRRNRREQVTEYYIGKAFVNARGQNFDRRDPDTWDFEGIDARWGERNGEGYDGLIILTVIDADVVTGCPYTQKDFALALEQKLIHHYKIDKNDARIRNRAFDEEIQGQEHLGYVVYIAVKITKDKDDIVDIIDIN